MTAMAQSRSDRRGGPIFFAVIAITIAIVAMVALAVAPDRVAGVRLIIRATARTSLPLFLAAFSASALARVRPTDTTRWLLANRRWLGLSFAWSHLVHLLAIFALVRSDNALFWTLTNPVSLAGGSITYVFIAAMAATSFNGAVRALGPQRWALLHRAGAWMIWLVFLISNAKRIPISGWYAVPCLFLIAAVALRLTVSRKTARRAEQAA